MQEKIKTPIILKGNIREINSFYHGAVQYVIQIKADTEMSDKTNGKVLTVYFEKIFNERNNHKEFCKKFYLGDKIIIEGYLNEDLKFEAKDILFVSEGK